MKRLKPYIRVSNFFLLALAGGVAFLIFVAVGRIFPSVYTPESPDSNEPYPFSLTPEFPVASSGDEAALRAASVAFLGSPEWNGPGVLISGWEFADVAALTRNGQRVGVYGDVAFPSPVTLAGEMTFIRCGQNETWRREGGPPFRMGGLHVRLLDGEDGPWFVLPLNADGEMPSLRDVAEYTGSANPCP